MNPAIDHTMGRVRLLTCRLRRLQSEAARFPSGATIHRLTNHIATTQLALELVEHRLLQGEDTQIEELFELVHGSLCSAHALLVRARQRRYGGRRGAVSRRSREAMRGERGVPPQR
jgi:hypothetical protein